MVRPPFTEIAPGHWVENCPVCVQLPVASRGQAGSFESSSPFADHESHRRTAPASALAAAQSHLERSPRPNRAESGDSSRAHELQEQLRELLTWAQQTGKVIPADRYLTPDEAGAEHRVFFDEVHSSAIKVTNPNRCGMSYPHGEPEAATPGEYLERWRLHNAVFGDDTELEGIIESFAGLAVVMRQRWIVGTVPTMEDITGLMRDLGFQPTALPECVYRAEDDIAVMDCHEGNFLLGENGIVFPIDVIPVRPDTGLKKRLGIHP